jgi:hypothetical protein
MIKLNKDFVTKESLLKYLNDLEIFQYYIDEEIIPGKMIISPLRNEKNPSFGLFKGTSGEICFKDFKGEGGDCIRFVQLLFNLTYFEALSKITIDFGMKDDFIVKEVEKTTNSGIKVMDRNEFLDKVSTYNIKKTSRKWLTHDLLFWSQYGVSISTLEFFNVQPISYFHIDNKTIKADKYAYCFIEFKDDNETYKIYQPFNEKYKWINSHDNSVWQGWNMLPNKGQVLIITKSLKDVMAIYETTGYPAVSLQSENVLPKEHIFHDLFIRFDSIYGLYDNDFDKEINWGRKFGEKLCDKFDICQIEIDEAYLCKDYSDLVKKIGKTKAIKELEKMIKPF